MAYQLIILTVLCASTQFLLKDCAGESTEDISRSTRKRPPNNLTCYVCHSETHSDCLNLLDDDIDEFSKFALTCSNSENSCMMYDDVNPFWANSTVWHVHVKKISFTTSAGSTVNSSLSMKTVAVKRNCSKKCEPGCVIMGERTRLYVCSTCCTSPLCNVGSDASKTMPKFNAVLMMPFTMIFQIFCFLLLPHHTTPR